MIAVPSVTMDEVALWYKMKEDLSKLKVAESLLRKRIFGHYFPAPEEGVNKFPLNDGTGFVIKGTRKIDRKVDEALLSLKFQELRDKNINPDVFLKRTYELKVSEYRKFTDEEIKLVDQILIIKDGSPELEIVKPARG